MFDPCTYYMTIKNVPCITTYICVVLDYVYTVLYSQVEEAAVNDLKGKLVKSEEERRKLVKECAIYQSQLEVCLCNVYVCAWSIAY